MSLGNKGVKDELQTDLVSSNITVKNSKEENVLGITFDNKLDFFLALLKRVPYQSTKIYDSRANDILNILFYKVSN